MRIQKKNEIVRGYRNRQKKYIMITSLLFLCVLLLACLMMVYGNTIYSFDTVIKVLVGEEIKGATFAIKTLRLPRMLAAILCGIAFGMAGNTFQTLLGNPLASPDIIGISSGASVAAVFGILILGLDGTAVSLLAVISGLFVAGFIYLISQGNGFSNGRLILTGIGIQAFLNAILSWLLLKASEYDVASALQWLSGSLNGVRLESIGRLAAVVVICGIAILSLNYHLQILQLGEVYAQVLGMKVHIIRVFLILLSLLMIAFATSVTGPLASVAFLSGPIAAKLSGGGRSNLLTSGLVGAILVLASDFVGQYCLPSRYPAGIITGILGAPYLLFLLLRMNRKGEN